MRTDEKMGELHMLGDNNNGNDELDPLAMMAMHIDKTDEKGLGAYIAKGMQLIPLKQRISLASQLVAKRFAQTHNVNLVYRNSDMYPKWVVKETFNELQFPCAIEDRKVFFELLSKAIANPPDQQAKVRIKQYIDEAKVEVTQMLLPFYHEYLESVKGDFEKKIQEEGKNLSNEEKQNQLSARMKEAKKQFLGHISFPFVESLVFELSQSDGFNATRKAQLSAGFRTLREKGIMDSVITSLDHANENYVSSTVDQETLDNAFKIFENRKEEFTKVLTLHHTKMDQIAKQADEFYQIVNKIAAGYPDAESEKIAYQLKTGMIDGIKMELDNKLLRGEIVSVEDVQSASDQLDTIMNSVNDDVNRKDEEGELPLHKAMRESNVKLTKALLHAGADPYATSVNYKRGVFKAIRDAFGGKGRDFFKNLTIKPPRTMSQIAKLYGNKEIIDVIEEKRRKLQTLQLPPEIVKLDDVLQQKPENSPEVIVEHPTLVGFNQRINLPQKLKNSEFVQNWSVILKSKIEEMNSVVINQYVLKEIHNYLTTNPGLEPPELDGLEKVLLRVENEGKSNLSLEVKQIISELRKGNLPEGVDDKVSSFPKNR